MITRLAPRLTRVERAAAFLGRPRAWLTLLGLAAAWVIVQLSLVACDLPPLDPFPFRWLQRTSIAANLAVILLLLGARRVRQERDRRLDALLQSARAARSSPPASATRH